MRTTPHFFLFLEPMLFCLGVGWLKVVRDTDQRVLLWNTIHALIVVREAETQFLDVDHAVQYIAKDVRKNGEKEGMIS